MPRHVTSRSAALRLLSASSSAALELRRSVSSEAGVLSNSTGDSLMAGAETASSGFRVVMGDIGVSELEAML